MVLVVSPIRSPAILAEGAWHLWAQRFSDRCRSRHTPSARPAASPGVLELLTIPGLGPDKVLKIYKTLGIASAMLMRTAETYVCAYKFRLCFCDCGHAQYRARACAGIL
jgi:hypothetical protein